jgi:hypothetical protein
VQSNLTFDMLERWGAPTCKVSSIKSIILRRALCQIIVLYSRYTSDKNGWPRRPVPNLSQAIRCLGCAARAFAYVTYCVGAGEWGCRCAKL